MFDAFFSKVNMKRWWMTAGAVFAWIFVSDMLIHGFFLKDVYQQTANLWRTQEDMSHFMGWMTGGQAMAALWGSFIFTKGYENKGWKEGARFGLLLGFFMISHFFIQFATTPMPMSLFWSWTWTGMIQCVGAGVVASFVYKK
ncbi:MAG: hypothetical protein JNL01_01605 [Bdellovibrionales bacterium]|nr:hypothetical protein [Bdellovibrionales bacterium]